jgi:hypothetical protein
MPSSARPKTSLCPGALTPKAHDPFPSRADAGIDYGGVVATDLHPDLVALVEKADQVWPERIDWR